MAAYGFEVLLAPLLLLCAHLPRAGCVSCWLYNIEHCNDFVRPYIPHAAIKHYSRAQLARFCAAKALYDACVDTIQPACARDVALQLQGAQDSNDFLCSPRGFELMVAHSECYKTPLVQRSAVSCDAELRRKLGLAQTTRKKCRLAEEYLDCVEEGIAGECGAEAGHFVYEANIRVLQPLYKDIGCDLRSDRHHLHGRAPGVGAPAWALLLAAAVMAAGL